MTATNKNSIEKYLDIFICCKTSIIHFKQDARVSSMRAFRQLAFESENATRRLAKVYTWKRQSLHVEIPNSTRGIFNVYWLSLV